MEFTWLGFQGSPGLLWLPERFGGYLLLVLYVVALGLWLRLHFHAPGDVAGRRLPLAGRVMRLMTRETAYALLLAAAAFMLAQLLQVRPAPERLPLLPGVAGETPSPVAPLLGSLPVIIAAGWLGPLPALLVGLASGLSRALWGSYHLTQIFESTFYALLVAFFLRQDYRGTFARWLRRPLLASMLAAVPYALLQTASAYAYTPPGSASSSWLVTLDYLVSLTQAALPGIALEMLAGGALAGIAYRLAPHLQPVRSGSLIWPFELNLNRKLLFAFVPAVILFTIALLSVQMTQAAGVAGDLAVTQMQLAAQDAAPRLRFFLTTGRSLLTALASDERLRTGDAAQAQVLLDREQRSVAFFQALILLDSSRHAVAAYPPLAQSDSATSQDEERALDLAGFTNSVIETPVHEGLAGPNTLTFVTTVLDPSTRQAVGFLVGRTALQGNPMMDDIIAGLQSTLRTGHGFIVDGGGRIIAHPDAQRVLQGWGLDEASVPKLRSTSTGAAYQGVAPDGTRELFYVERVQDSNWSVVVSVPNQEVLALAADLSQPMLYVLVLGGLVAAFGIVYLSGRVTRPLRALAGAAGTIAGGTLDSPVGVAGEDEVGQLGAAFERMRLSLKARLDELGLLLEVTQNVAASLDLERGLPPILNGALKATEAAGARITLVASDGRRPPAFAAGPLGPAMEPLDEAVLNLARAEKVVQIEHVARQRARLDPGPLAGRLQAVFALPLCTQERLDGVLWLGYPAPHHFSETEIAFLTTLAHEASVVLENARLFETAEGGRRRLSAILSSTTDPMIVTDRGDRLLLMNPAAETTFDADNARAAGRPVAEALYNPVLVELLNGKSATPTREIKVADGRTFYAAVSPITAGDGQVLGRVAVLRDITAIKALDEMKSDFVATVSHDLRGPLSSMRGYATMLTVVGELNSKQKEYAGKMVASIEHMAHLIEDLLDLGRIEAGVGLAREQCDIEELVGQVVESVRAQAVAKGLNLRLDVAPELPALSGDPMLLRQAVVNLVDNAVKYTVSGEVSVRVSVSAATPGRPAELVIAVRDTGIGIAPADQLHLFEKFFRVKRRDTLNIKGSGLGLAIVKSIAERHGGRVAVESRLGEGSIFSISLPLAA